MQTYTIIINDTYGAAVEIKGKNEQDAIDKAKTKYEKGKIKLSKLSGSHANFKALEI